MNELEKTEVSIRISGDGLDPNEITRLLGRQPDRAEMRGDEIFSPSGSWRIARRKIWIIRATSQSPGALNEQISALLEETTNDIRVWQEITSKFNADVFCGLFFREDNAGESLASETLYNLGIRGLKLNLDMYAPDKE